MIEKQKIINIAVIAHVDAGKSTLVDAFLNQSGVFRANEEAVDCVMDRRHRKRKRHNDIFQELFGNARRCEDQHRRYAGTCGLFFGSRENNEDCGHGHPAGGFQRGAYAADQVRASEVP